MKNKILLALASALILTPLVHATDPDPVGVPDTGSTLGLFAVVALAAVALRRKFSK